MEELIQIHNQGTELLVDSRKVAEVFDVHHKGLRELIEENEAEFSMLGFWRFETAKIRSSSGSEGKGRPEKFYWLNFDQIAFLLTLTRTTERTKDLRFRLIIAFRLARERLRPVDTILLAIPDKWKKTFPDSFYIALLGLYGDTFEASTNKPSWVGWWTNKFIYEPIFDGLPLELKGRRNAYAGTSGKDPDYIKLHQFLETSAKEELRDQVTKVTTLLQLGGSKLDFLERYLSVFHGQTQGKLSLEWRDFR